MSLLKFNNYFLYNYNKYILLIKIFTYETILIYKKYLTWDSELFLIYAKTN